MDLASLQQFISGLDVSANLSGLSYSLTSNYQLGFGGDAFSPFKFIPYGTWQNYDNLPWDAPVPSVLELAFSETITEGHKYFGEPDPNYSFIDILHLANVSTTFFTEPIKEGRDAGKSLVEVIASTVDSMHPEVTPVIRFLQGDPNAISEVAAPPPPEFADIFWPGGRPIISHKNAVLWAGKFNPDIPLAQDVDNVVNGWIKALVDATTIPFDDIIALALDIAVDYLINNTLPGDVRPLTWNHAKIVAVNGRALLTGGGNYFDLYTTEFGGSLIDNDITIMGDAALTAHNYADYLWDYLNSNPSFDLASQKWSAPLNIPGGLVRTWYPAPMFPRNTPGLKGTVDVLATNKIGNFNPGGGVVQYPAQILTAVRDILHQLVWALTPPLVADLVANTSDTALLQDGVWGNLGVNPAAWASRSARAYAISKATDHVYMSQQMLVNWDMVTVPSWMNAVGDINDLIWLIGGPWDGKVWPFDVLVALANAIVNIEKNHPMDLTKGVYLILSQYASPKDPAPQGYQDTTTIKDLTSRLTVIVRSLTSDAEAIVARRFHVRRSVLKNKGPSDVALVDKKLHTKVVDVDGKLLYTGSDNAYPQWNEQFGVWIEEERNIKAWEDEFFLGLWERAHEVD